MISQSNKKFREKVCSVPESLLSDCKGGIVKAHTLSKSSALKKISENGKVLGINIEPAKFHRGEESIVPKEINISKASIFTGFCKKHDMEIFSPIENKAFEPTLENCFLISYRAISREIYLKKSVLKTSIPQLREADRGRDLQTQLMIQKITSEYERRTSMTDNDSARIKKQLDMILVNKSYELMSHYIIEVKEKQKIASSGSILPDFDFNGKLIQDLNHNYAETIIFNLFPNKEKGFFIFSWLKSEKNVAELFIDSLKNKRNQSDLLTGFLLSHCENTFYTPSWLRSLGPDAQANLSRRLHDGLTRPITPRTLELDIAPYYSFEIEKQYYLT